MEIHTFDDFFGLKTAENSLVQHFSFPEYENPYFLTIFWSQNVWKFSIPTLQSPLNMKIRIYWRRFRLKMAENSVFQHFSPPEYENPSF